MISNDTAFAVARFCLSAPFLFSGADKLLRWSVGLEEFRALGLPLADLLLAATIVVQIGAGAMLLVGPRVRIAALLLAGFTLAATLVAHRVWEATGPAFTRELTTALEHLAIVGGLLLVALVGGRRAADERSEPASAPPAARLSS